MFSVQSQPFLPDLEDSIIVLRVGIELFRCKLPGSEISLIFYVILTKICVEEIFNQKSIHEIILYF